MMEYIRRSDCDCFILLQFDMKCMLWEWKIGLCIVNIRNHLSNQLDRSTFFGFIASKHLFINLRHAAKKFMMLFENNIWMTASCVGL